MTDSAIARFTAIEGSEEVLDLLRLFVDVFELPRETAGTNWGVSMRSDRRGRMVRVNAANQQILCAYWDATKGWRCSVMAPRLPYVSDAATRHALDVEWGQHAEPYPDQVILSGTLGDIGALLHEQHFCDFHRDFVNAYASRRLLNASWSKDAVVALVLGEQHRSSTNDVRFDNRPRSTEEFRT